MDREQCYQIYKIYYRQINNRLPPLRDNDKLMIFFLSVREKCDTIFNV